MGERTVHIKDILSNMKLKNDDPYVVQVMAQDGPPPRARRLSTGCEALDVLIGGGYPEGHISIIHGKDGSGKSTLALQAAVQCQRAHGIVVYCDMERKLDLVYAARLGVDLDEMAVSYPEHIEGGFELLERVGEQVRAADEDIPFLYVWDSLQAPESRRAYDRGYRKDDFSPEASAYSRYFRKAVRIAHEYKATFLAIDQVRADIGGFVVQDKFGVGKAVLHYATLIMAVSLKEKKQTSLVPVGSDGAELTCKLRKLSWGRGGRSVTTGFLFGHGTDPASGLLVAAEAVGLAVPISQRGMRYEITIGDEKVKVNGVTGMAKMIEKAPEKVERLREEVRNRIQMEGLAPLADDEESDMMLVEDEEEEPEGGGSDEGGMPKDDDDEEEEEGEGDGD